MSDFSTIHIEDITSDGLKGVRCVNPDELMLHEHREEELVGGIILMAVSTQKFDQVDVVPKWRVLAVGDNVEKEIGVKPGDLVIVGKHAGRFRELDMIDVRFVHHKDVFAKVTMEIEDYESYIKGFYASRGK